MKDKFKMEFLIGTDYPDNLLKKAKEQKKQNKKEISKRQEEIIDTLVHWLYMKKM